MQSSHWRLALLIALCSSVCLSVCLSVKSGFVLSCIKRICNKKHLKNVGPIRYNKPPHAHSPDVASDAVARRLRIDVHDNANDDNDDNDNDNA